ncbi:peptidase S8 [Kitasatospora sp. MMS16-BH015]|uniref:S53 family peptidase n=1 Tax=Kitasatospora sp. MMS16-BH015 TaxID=2018025 RepID=UPI000CA35000|nr:S53 family peptidase [Kitasatospora sp. MMS16-BH015]AUG75167.1 peptidase S8 [Kitasatospora sp. MMS16-BH015]
MKLRLRPVIGLLAAPLPVLALAATPVFAATPADSTGSLTAARSTNLRGDLLPAVSHSIRTGKVAADRRISVAVSLNQRDTAGLDTFLAQVTDPKSTQYKHYLTVNQFAQRFGATPATVAKVTEYLKSQGLTVSPATANHLTIEATGTAAQVERAFGTSLATFHDPTTQRDFFANTTAPALPAEIASVVSDVSGLNDFAKYSHHATATKQADPNAVTRAPSGLSPAKARTAYNVGSAISAGYTGKGSTVALLEFSAFKQSNVTAYDKYYSLTPSTPTVVSAGGGTTDLSGEDEVELDIEVVQALAPGAAIKVYEAPNSDAGETAIYAKLVSDNVPIISISWGIYEAGETASNRTAVDTDLKEAAAQGQSVYAASGDSGSDDAGNGGTSVDFPAADPWVTGTGGTTLKTTSTNAWSSETAWSGSGGGVSSSFATPSYQSAVNTTGHRTVPDVAAVADPSTGWAIYTQGAWYTFGGTSAAAPNWAAFTALYNSEAAAKSKPAFGFANGTIYNLAASASRSTAFHDVTTGSNGAYSAASGYDKVTGWGSYNGANFLKANLG